MQVLIVVTEEGIITKFPLNQIPCKDRSSKEFELIRCARATINDEVAQVLIVNEHEDELKEVEPPEYELVAEGYNSSIEIGQNLKELLLAMVDKIESCRSVKYYESAYKDIRKIIVDSIAETVKEGEK